MSAGRAGTNLSQVTLRRCATAITHLNDGATDVLQPGDRLGTVDDTGSLEGAYLYFEIRDHGAPLNPSDWLRR